MKNLIRIFFSLLMVAILLLGGSLSTAGASIDPAPVSLRDLGVMPQPEWLRYDPNAPAVNVPPPAQYFQPHPQAATFSITYVPNGAKSIFGYTCLTFPDEAKAAFSNAANYWGSLLTSPVPIRIQACWAPLGPDILGGSASLNSMANYPNFPILNTWYPVTLANALEGSDLDPGWDDMAIVYSSNYAANFYYGTGPVPPDKIDFTSVVMHEIGHGLGFAGTMTMCGSNGVWGFNWDCTPFNPLYPDTYDRFAVDSVGHALIDPYFYTNNSIGLAAALKSNNLYFNGENAKAANGGVNVKLFAPSTWIDGSSYAHLDYLTFAGTQNALMVFALGDGYAIHDPGPVGMGLLNDVGWAPFAPSDLTITNSNNSQVRLSWISHSRNQIGFKIERSADGSTGWAQIGTSTSTTYTDSGLPQNDFFFYRVRAYHNLGDSRPSNIVPLPLAAPGNLTAIAIAPQQVELSWTDPNNNETGYQIYRSIKEANNFQLVIVSPTNSITYSDTSVVPGTAYDYEVRAIHSNRSFGPSPWSFASAVTPLNSPLGFNAVSATYPGQVTLTWQDANDNETGYRVESSLAAGGPWTAMCETQADATGCSGTGLQELTLYYFQVHAFNAVAVSAVASTSAVTTLMPPTGLTASTLPGTGVNLHWTNHSLLATGIELQRSLDGLADWVPLPAGLSPSDTSFTDNDVIVGEVYYYRLRAISTAPVGESPFTPTVTAITGPNWVFLPVINR